MKTSTLCIFLLLPQFASAQSSLSPEAQSAYDDAMRGVNETAASQIRQHEAQSRQAQQNINQLLLDQQLERLADQQAEFRRQELEQQRRQQQLVEESLRQQRAGSVQPSWQYNQPTQHMPPAQSQPSIGGGDVFAKAVADLEMGNYAGNVAPPPTLQQPSSLDILREAGVVDATGARRRIDVVGDLALMQQLREQQSLEAYRTVVDALTKQGCIAFKMEVNNPLPVCSAWKTPQSLPGVVSSAAVGMTAVNSAAQATPPIEAVQYAGQASPVVAGKSSWTAPLVALGVFAVLLGLLFLSAYKPRSENEHQEKADAV